MSTDLFYYTLFWITIGGLCFGSFFNVVILRSLSGESIVLPASKCPKCGSKLRPWHNIPVLSYIFLRGKCAFCKDKISIQYPIIELATAALFATCFIKFGIEWKTLFSILICSGLLIMSVTDIKEKLVDCNIAIILAVIGVLYNWLVIGDVLNSIYGLLIAAIALELSASLGHLFKKGRAFGEADTYVAGALGACFGLNSLLQIFIYTLFAAALFTVPIFLYNQFKKNNKGVCILSIFFILAILAYKNIAINWYTFTFLALSGLGLIIVILKNLVVSPVFRPLALTTVPPLAPASLAAFIT